MTSKFQIIVIGIFVLFIIIGVAAFATYKSSSKQQLPTVTIWGTVPATLFQELVLEANKSLPQALPVTYVEKKEATFNQEFVEALAQGIGPDAVILPQEAIFAQENKFLPIPYTSYTERQFKDTFIGQGEVFLTDAGILAFPFSIDPMVMYWNRSIFANEGVASYPRTWDEITALSSKITKKDNNSNLSQSLAALGEYRNVTHARELLSTLFMQVGDPITVRNNETYDVKLGEAGVDSDSVLSFYTNFSNPVKPVYSWNRSLPQAKTYFTNGNLGLYFGFASEINDIRSKNPNLNFDIAPFPQLKNTKNKITYGKMYGIAIPKNSQNVSTAFLVMQYLVGAPVQQKLSILTYLPPVRRDLLAESATDPYMDIFYTSALISKAWVDLNSGSSDVIFQNMVESVISGRNTPVEALRIAKSELSAAF